MNKTYQIWQLFVVVSVHSWHEANYGYFDILIDMLSLKMGVGGIRWLGDFGERDALCCFPFQLWSQSSLSPQWIIAVTGWEFPPSKRLVTSEFLKTIFRTFWATSCTGLTLVAPMDAGTSWQVPWVLQISLRLIWLGWLWGPFQGQQENKVSSITEIGQGNYSGATCFSPWIRD